MTSKLDHICVGAQVRKVRVSYGTKVTAYVEPTKIKKLTGVNARELLMWITLTEITMPCMNADKVTFQSSVGLSKTYPAEAFMAEDVDSIKDATEVKKVENISEPAAAEVKEV